MKIQGSCVVEIHCGLEIRRERLSCKKSWDNFEVSTRIVEAREL